MKGKLIFDDASQSRFVLQEEKIRTLTEEYDILLTTMAGQDGKLWLAVKCSDLGTIGTPEQFCSRINLEPHFACMRTLYDDLDPAALFAYVRGLISHYDVNSNILNKFQSFCVANKTEGFKEIDEEAFYNI